MNKVILFKAVLMALVCMAVFSCKETEVSENMDSPTLQLNNTEGDSLCKIILYTSEPGRMDITTRGTGAFDKDSIDSLSVYYREKIKNSVFNVFAFRNAPTVNFTRTVTNDPRREECLIDDSLNYYSGKPALLAGNDFNAVEIVHDTDSFKLESMYYGDFTDYGYNFYMYHIDDCIADASTVSRTADSISIQLTLDGTQDIMYGRSSTLTRDYLKQYPELKDSEKQKLMEIGGFCSYAANRGVYPIVRLYHALPRLRFMAYPADSLAKNIVIRKVGLVAPCRGHLNVVGRDMTVLGAEFDKDYQDTLILCNPSSDGRTKAQPLDSATLAPWNPTISDVWKQKPVRLGESILPAPASSYRLIVWTEETLNKGDGQPHIYKHKMESTVTLRNNQLFYPGYGYTVSIAVYGAKNIDFSVDVNDWQWVNYGTGVNGSIPVTPDDEDDEFFLKR